MYLERAYRQITLVSYGNEYLNNSVNSEIIDRHPLLFNHFPILRDTQHGTLLCGSASHILSSLIKLGAYKLSLHISHDLKLELQNTRNFSFSTSKHDFCIIVHFNDSTYKVLIQSDELPLWQEADDANSVHKSYEDYRKRISYDYSNYYQNVEIYTLHDLALENTSTIERDLTPLNWDNFFKDTESYLYKTETAKKYGIYPITLDTNNCYEGNLFNRSKVEQYPLLPFTIRQNYASNLIENIAILEHQYTGASHPKNEYSDYIQMDDNEQKEFNQAYDALINIQPIIFKHCANHYQNSGIHNSNYFSGQLSNNDSLNNTSILSELSQPHQTYPVENEKIDSIETKEVSTPRLLNILKFFWWILWCYCALWTLTYFTAHWGNIFIITFALFYALYRSLKSKRLPINLKLRHKKDR